GVAVAPEPVEEKEEAAETVTEGK
ncbi:MAG: hypothetical protein Greene101449_1069, partial [Candidatus Peregrinibacteria bacterium Greene1014_49]